ncbi:MAG TPA: YaiO family outer membrane beta-barrel protein [Sphingobium sp.]|nr:YaiO family outer membrane beta-barrel protein [Sphingobium sp.]
MSPVLICAFAFAAAPSTQSANRDREIEQARAALMRQDSRAAIPLLEKASQDFPGDAEVLRLLGSAYAFDRRYPEAIATLRRALAVAPDDQDIRAALARAYLWSGDKAAAEGEVSAIEHRSPGNAEAAAIRRQLRTRAGGGAGEGSYGLAAAQSFSHVTFANRPSRTWSNTTLGIYGRITPGTTVALAAEREDRRMAVDTRIEGRIDQRLGLHARAFVAFARTPDADFREKWGVTGGVEADVASFVTLLADLRHAEYSDASVTVLQPGVRLSARSLGLDATIRMINLWDEQGTHRAGVSGRVDRSFANGATLYAGAATYPDTEAGITRQVHSLFAGAAVPVSGRITLRAGLDYDRRRATYTRKGASLGLQFRF